MARFFRPSADSLIVDVICMVRRRTARRIGFTRTVCENVSGLLVENDLRAHDDDPRVPVLANRHGRERPCYVTGFQARRLTVFSYPIPLQTSEKRISRTNSSSWKGQGLCASGDSRSRWPKRPRCPGQLIGVATITTLRAALVSNSLITFLDLILRV
jgi:hypothetical protein